MKNIEDLRKQIDKLDDQIVSLLEKRMKTVKKIGQLKKKNNIQVFDKERWQKVIKSKKGFVKKIWETIHDESLKIERSV
jgi:chorismate mutase